MSVFAESLGMIAPYYNLVFTAIAFYLFMKFFKTKPKTKVFFLPWIYILLAMIIFILEEATTVLRVEGLINIPVHINGFFELVIIALFIYTLLLQKQYVKKHY